jgi:hypothetical protein
LLHVCFEALLDFTAVESCILLPVVWLCCMVGLGLGLAGAVDWAIAL